MENLSLPPGHFDVNLKKWLQGKGGQDRLRFGYLFPPMGHWAPHKVSVDQDWTKKGGRPTHWEEPWMCEVKDDVIEDNHEWKHSRQSLTRCELVSLPPLPPNTRKS